MTNIKLLCLTIEEGLTEFIDWMTEFSPEFPVYKYDNVEAIGGKPVFLLDGVLTRKSDVFMIVLGNPYLDKTEQYNYRVTINSAIGSVVDNLEGECKYERIPIIVVEEKNITKGDDSSYLSLKILFDQIQLYPNLFPYLKNLLINLVERYPETKKDIERYLEGVDEIYDNSIFELLVKAEVNAFIDLLDDLITQTCPGKIKIDLGNGFLKFEYMAEITEPDDVNSYRDYLTYAIDLHKTHMKEKILLMQIRLYDLGNDNLRIVGYRCFRHPVVIKWLGKLKQEIEFSYSYAPRKVKSVDKKNDNSKKPTPRTQKIFKEAKKFKDANPKYGKAKVAECVSGQLGEHVTENSITYAYRQMGEKWPRKKTQK